MQIDTVVSPNRIQGEIWVEKNELLKLVGITVACDNVSKRIYVTIEREDDSIPVEIHLP